MHVKAKVGVTGYGHLMAKQTTRPTWEARAAISPFQTSHQLLPSFLSPDGMQEAFLVMTSFF
jgi:hypothetical protein